MKNLSHSLIATCAATVVSCALTSVPARSQAPDNSGANKSQSLSADDQANAKEDRLTTANVRKAIVADKNLSLYAHNVKIITHGGHVTLKGPVKSEEEKKQVLTDAANAVSADAISDELTVRE